MFTSSNPTPTTPRLKVTAGTSYSPSTHQPVNINSDSPLRLTSPLITSSLWVRIQNHNPSPPSTSSTNAYFAHPPTTKNLYSLTFTLRFPASTHVTGNDLLFGNDFDHPIREYLPPGFGTGLRIVKSVLDPSLEGDAYADKPYLLSPGVAAWNFFSIGEKKEEEEEEEEEEGNLIVSEGSTGSGIEERQKYHIPEEAGARRSHFLREDARKEFVFEGGRTYAADFGNPYLDFNEFAIRLPGISFHIRKYVSEKNNVLRYVLKNRGTGEVYFVVCFTVDLEGDADDDEYEGEGEGEGEDSDGDSVD
ncbi:DUF1769-domain-containing protein [Aspergillus heteromorphus CBS 117.55]|uniref:DUF1769-domain-containing protein n=1 Tax=Aspergillus heteromorphus CBS 117.55 TaxID=1448321 RepID=A0A317WT45_9EURO|nr:DUF1769-domain-containing protein [Aspergillus heteromorphus CBS 117.55]PWY87410.1 DUF1769-domain-containing protein [Aspergillus heteromorphus CBS 117.55]